MESNGIMAEIRTQLSNGKSSGEVIALGYKASTVYKVQRQLRSQLLHRGPVGRDATKAPSATGPGEPDGWPNNALVIRCSPPAYRFIAQVAGKTGLPMWESLDLLIGCAIDDQWGDLEGTLDTWDIEQTSEYNAPAWLPLSHVDYQDNLIEL